MLNVDTKSMTIFMDFYMPIFNAIYTKVNNIRYEYNPENFKFVIKTFGKKLVVDLDNYKDIFENKEDIANEWQEWYYNQLNEEVEENANTNGKR